ncbi:hypothetical protein [Wolbachia pipientis]|nr:hypothetical protein [Wolbachia pipientis]MDM8335313.1 hypothetical protein [Wolbachia pipientis]
MKHDKESDNIDKAEKAVENYNKQSSYFQDTVPSAPLPVYSSSRF